MFFKLSEEQELLRQSVAGFAQDVIAPGAKEREQNHLTPDSVMKAMGEQGLLGVNIPAEHGGAEAGVVAYALAIREIARADASVAVTTAVTNMVAEVITRFGSGTQKAKYLPGLLSGDFFGGAFALSETGAGSDPAGMQTKAQKTDKGWVLNGEKMWISHGDRAGVMVVWARTGDGQNGHKDISCFLVPGDAPGVSAGKPEEKMGLLASHTVAVSFDGVEVPEDALLHQEGQGFPIAMVALDGGRIGIAAQSMGIAEAAMAASVQYAKERQQFGKHLGDFQAIQFKLADMRTQMDAAWLLALRAAWLKEKGVKFSREAAMAKVFASESANRVVREAVQIHGGYGYIEEFPVARHYRDCRVTQIYEGTSEIQRLVIAREVLRRQ